MKKLILSACLAAALLSETGCATIFFSGEDHCKTKPATGTRKVHSGALVFDILLFWPAAFVDWADHAIYKPCNNK